MQFTATESTVLKNHTVSLESWDFNQCEKPQPTTAVTDKNELQGGSQWEHSWYHGIKVFLMFMAAWKCV